MTSATRHNLVATTVLASNIVVEKAASASPDEREVIGAVFPSDSQETTKMAALARVLATADMVEG